MMTSNTLSTNPHTEYDECSTEQLVARFNKHVQAVESNILKANAYVYAVLCARGLRSLLVERAMASGDDETLNLMWGAPHWLTYNDGTLQAMLERD